MKTIKNFVVAHPLITAYAIGLLMVAARSIDPIAVAGCGVIAGVAAVAFSQRVFS